MLPKFQVSWRLMRGSRQFSATAIFLLRNVFLSPRSSEPLAFLCPCVMTEGVRALCLVPA